MRVSAWHGSLLLAMSCATAFLAMSCATTDPFRPPAPGPEPVIGTRTAAATDSRMAPATTDSRPPAGDVEDLPDPEAYANQLGRPDNCERGARALQDRSRDRAWAVLKICIEQHGFTGLPRLLEDAWDADLQSRPDAMYLLTRLIANRGGDVVRDVGILSGKRIPLFSLAQAVSEPQLYQNRLVVLRAGVTSRGVRGDMASVRLTEFSLGSELTAVEVGPATEYRRKSRREVNMDGRAQTPRGNYSGSARATDSYSSHSTRVQTQKRSFNVDRKTDLEALGRLDQADPFFGGNDVYVVLTRFEGVTSVQFQNADSAQTVPVLRVLAYHRPSSFVVRP